ncbi:hypothetical protein L596_011778 [Steinernema carpocapsae]|uniref:Uncharacterized protein n=1 Tax=Steinernema carpocapsae TaxID=34508 RepID=A0A4U5NVH1_STECR|nr:hypothetical protein L596_011778 [Steinernema carpocapsae]
MKRSALLAVVVLSTSTAAFTLAAAAEVTINNVSTIPTNATGEAQITVRDIPKEEPEAYLSLFADYEHNENDGSGYDIFSNKFLLLGLILSILLIVCSVLLTVILFYSGQMINQAQTTNSDRARNGGSTSHGGQSTSGRRMSSRGQRSLERQVTIEEVTFHESPAVSRSNLPRSYFRNQYGSRYYGSQYGPYGSSFMGGNRGAFGY